MTPVNQSSGYVMPGVLSNITSVSSWLNKTVSSLPVDKMQPVINTVQKTSPYLSFSSLCQSVLSTSGIEIASAFYQEKQLLSEKQICSDNTQQESTNNLKDSSDVLSVKKESLQAICEQPLWGKMELSTTLLSTLAWNGIPALTTGVAATSVIPITAAGIMVTAGATIATRLVKRSVYAYRLSQVETEMQHFKQYDTSKSNTEISVTEKEIMTKSEIKKPKLTRDSISAKHSIASERSKMKMINKKYRDRSSPY